MRFSTDHRLGDSSLVSCNIRRKHPLQTHNTNMAWNWLRTNALAQRLLKRNCGTQDPLSEWAPFDDCRRQLPGTLSKCCCICRLILFSFNKPFLLTQYLKCMPTYEERVRLRPRDAICWKGGEWINSNTFLFTRVLGLLMDTNCHFWRAYHHERVLDLWYIRLASGGWDLLYAWTTSRHPPNNTTTLSA